MFRTMKSRIQCVGVGGFWSFHFSNINCLAESMIKAIQSDSCKIFVRLYDSRIIPKMAIKVRSIYPRNQRQSKKQCLKSPLGFVQDQNICAWDAGVNLQRSQEGSICWKCLEGFSFVQCTILHCRSLAQTEDLCILSRTDSQSSSEITISKSSHKTFICERDV